MFTFLPADIITATRNSIDHILKQVKKLVKAV